MCAALMVSGSPPEPYVDYDAELEKLLLRKQHALEQLRLKHETELMELTLRLKKQKLAHTVALEPVEEKTERKAIIPAHCTGASPRSMSVKPRAAAPMSSESIATKANPQTTQVYEALRTEVGLEMVRLGKEWVDPSNIVKRLRLRLPQLQEQFLHNRPWCSLWDMAHKAGIIDLRITMGPFSKAPIYRMRLVCTRASEDTSSSSSPSSSSSASAHADPAATPVKAPTTPASSVVAPIRDVETAEEEERMHREMKNELLHEEARMRREHQTTMEQAEEEEAQAAIAALLQSGNYEALAH
jgi:hypothetical protein